MLRLITLSKNELYIYKKNGPRDHEKWKLLTRPRTHEHRTNVTNEDNPR